MRIRTAFVESFGRMRDRRFDFSVGLNVVYGPNESGKTTLMEFIRSTISPPSKRSLYPSREKADRGTLVVEEDGVEHRAVLKGRAVSGYVPGSEGLDPNLYRSVFAMNQGDLDNDKVLTGGEIKTRFLTVPGGAGMAEAIGSIEDSLSSVLGKTAASPSEYNAIADEISNVDSRISELKSNAEMYAQITRELEEKRAALRELQGRSGNKARDRDLFKLYEANRANYDSLADLNGQLQALGSFTPAGAPQSAEDAGLEADLRSKESARQAAEAKMAEERSDLRGADARRVKAHQAEIQALPGREQALRESEPKLRRMTDEISTLRSRPVPAPNKRGIPIPGIVLAVVGIAIMAVGALITSIPAIAAGAIVIIAGAAWSYKGRGGAQSRADASADEQRIAQLEREVSEIRDRSKALDEDVARIMADVGMKGAGTSADIQFLQSALVSAVSLGRTEMDVMRAKQSEEEARNAVMAFLMPYGGKDGFDRSLSSTAKATDLQTRIRAVSDTIRQAGLDPSNPVCPVAEVTDDSGEMQSLSRDIGVLENQQRSILDTAELDTLMDRRAELKAREREILRRGAVLILARHIAQTACDDIYSTVQPGVVTTADRYLGLMTGGRYGLEIDPETGGLEARSGVESKTESQWSTGLRAQVLLSVKLAVARELGDGRMPVILDDVLLPFDSERKAGALRALADVSGEMQVLLFTCDSETRSLSESMDGVNVITM